MDGAQTGVGSEIPQVGKGLLELLRKKLCPAFVRDADLILAVSPWEEADYRVGIYLYDVQDYSVMAAEEVRLSETKRRLPPKAVELSYLVFCNESRRFGGVQREQIQILLNEIVRAVYDNPVLETEDGGQVQLSFLREDAEFKIRLWGSFDRPLQPAVYIKAAPVLVASCRTREAVSVRERNYDVKKRT